MPSTEKSYTAEVTVTEATTITPDRPNVFTQQPAAPTYTTAEVAQVVLRADTLEQLKEKVAAHVALI